MLGGRCNVWVGCAGWGVLGGRCNARVGYQHFSPTANPPMHGEGGQGPRVEGWRVEWDRDSRAHRFTWLPLWLFYRLSQGQGIGMKEMEGWSVSLKPLDLL